MVLLRGAEATFTATPQATAGPTGSAIGPDGVPIRDVQEFFVSPVTGDSYRIHKDLGLGTYEYCSSGGACFATREEIMALEAERLPSWAVVVEPTLRQRISDAGPGSNEEVGVIIELRDATFARVASAEWARVESKLRALEGLASKLPEPAPANDPVLQRIDALVDTTRHDIYSQADDGVAPMIDEMRAGVVALGGRFEGFTPVLPAVFARIPLVSIPRLAMNPWVVRISEDRPVDALMNVSAYAIHADTWWTNGYTGGPWDLTVEDTGIDRTHPAIPNGPDRVFHAAGQMAPNYADNPANPDDLHSHGTHVAGTVASVDTVYRGVAYGLDQLINTKAGWLTTGGGGQMVPSDGMTGIDWAVGTAGADVVSLSFGGYPPCAGDTAWERFFDAVVDGLGVAVAIAAGNAGSSPCTMNEPGAAFNIFSVGAVDDRNTISRSDDGIAGFSSRGPTADGRLKPDISAPGVDITSTYAFWETGPDFVSFSGTSMATPHVAASIILLMNGIGSTFPPRYKALLLNTAEDKTPAGPDTAYGWGYIDLAAAYTARNNVREGNVTGGAVRYVFYRGAATPGDRATLVWNRHAVYVPGQVPTTFYPLNDLDLYAYNEADGSRMASSTRTVDNVEQVVIPINVAAAVYKVRAPATLSGVTREHHAIAVPAGTAAVLPPSLSVALSGPATAEIGTPFTITADITDTGQLAAQAVSVTVTLPPGLSLVSGASPQSIGRIASGVTRPASWQVMGSTLGLQTVTANAQSMSYEETFNGSGGPYSVTIQDTIRPVSSVDPLPASETTSTFSVAASASDSGGVANVELFERKDGGTWTSYGNDTASPWRWSFDTTGLGGDGLYEFYSLATDRASNVENKTAIPEASTTVDTSPPTSITQPLPVYETTAAFTVTANASDLGSGVASVNLYYHRIGGPWALLGTDSAEPWSWVFDSVAAGGDGVYEFYSVATDNIGNPEEPPALADVSTTVDTAPPDTVRTLSGSSGLGPWFVSEVGVRLTASDFVSGLASTVYRVDGGPWLPYSAPFLVAGDGIHTLEYTSTDNAGNVELTQTVGIFIDTTPPTTRETVSGTSGANGWFRSGVMIDLTTSDQTSGPNGTEFQLDGGVWQAYSGTVVVSAEGQHAMMFRSIDAAGNMEAEQTLQFKLDLTAPHSQDSLSGTPGNGGWYRSSVSVTVQATDGLSGVATLEYREGDDTWTAYPGDHVTFVVDPDGSHTIDFRATDAAGNPEEVQTLEFKIDATPPAIAISEPGGGPALHSSSVLLRWSATDSGSGVSGCSVAIDGGIPVPSSAPGSHTIENVQDGTHAGTVTCLDVAGNSKTSIVEFTVDTSVIGTLSGIVGSGPWFFILIALLVAAVAVLAFVVARRRRKDNSGSPQEPPPPPAAEPGEPADDEFAAIHFDEPPPPPSE